MNPDVPRPTAATTMSSRDLRELRAELPEDGAQFLDAEREELGRRWRVLAPIVLLLIVAGEIAPLFSPDFPPNIPLSASMVVVIGTVLGLSLRRASYTALSLATVAAAVWGGIYGGLTAADAGGFRSIHLLGMVLVIACLPGVFSMRIGYSIAALGGSLVAFFVSCAVSLHRHGGSMDGIAVASFYCAFLAAFAIYTVERGRRLRYRAFVSRRVADRLHQFAVEEVLCRHLPPQFVRRVLSGEQSLNAAPERRVITVLFADIVSFTPLSEKLSPEKLATLMARFYESTGKAAFQRGATIDKFIGDAVMAILGAPEEMAPEEQAKRAVEVAKAWHEAAASLQSSDGDVAGLHLRIGIHQDVVAVGVFGGQPRSDYTVLGRGVNIAARLEQRCRPGEIVLSEHVVQKLNGAPGDAVDLGLLQLKGIPDPVRCFSIPVRPVARVAEA